MFIKINMLGDKKKKNKKMNGRGFTLVEFLIYTAGLIILVVIIAMIIVQLYGLYRQITIVPRADRVGLIVIDRIVKDIRSGRSVDLGQSDLGVSNGQLYMVTNVSGSTVDKFFDLSEGRITYQEDGGVISFLSPSDMEITKFRFDHIVTAISDSIRVEIDITFQNGDTTVIKEYQGFATLRHSYE